MQASRFSPLVIALAGLLSLAIAMGIGRFAFTPLLPMMLHEGSVDLAGGSWLATLNYIGYFVGALVCMFIKPAGARVVRFGLIATALLTLAMAFPGGLLWWSVWRTASGVASAFVMVYTAGWCMQKLAELNKPALTGIIFCGPGVGITLTGVSVFGMVAADWTARWGWAVFSVLAFVLTLLIWPVFTPVRSIAPGGRSMQAAPKLTTEALCLTFAYGLAGFGYIITATFLPVIARQALPGSVLADLFWPIFGIGVALGALATTRLSQQHDNRKLLTWMYLVQAVGVFIAAVWPTTLGLALSSLLAGLPFTALVSFAMAEARRLWGPQAPRLMGLMTAAYGLGQIAGPPFATALVLRTDGFAASLVVAAATLVLGSGIYAFMRVRFPAQAIPKRD